MQDLTKFLRFAALKELPSDKQEGVLNCKNHRPP